MTSDPAARLERLRRKLAEASELDDRADLAAAVAALEKEQASNHSQSISGDARTGVAVAGSASGPIVAPLFSEAGSGNNIAGVINIYGQLPTAPQVDYGAALRRYLENLYSRHARLDLRGIDDRPMDMPLSELYVSLSLHEPPPDELRRPGALRGFFEKLRGKPQPETELLHKSGPTAVDWPQALRHPRLAVVGAPGSGKTTLLHYTAVRLAEILARDENVRLAELGLEGAPPVPLLLPLRELGEYLRECGHREASSANPRLLLGCLANYYGRFELNLPDDFFRKLCETGRALLLLDGLDEVARGEDRVFVSGIVREFAQRYQNCRYVVTARIAAYHGDAQIGAGFRISTVADLNDEQQRRFISNWSHSLHRLLYNLQGAELDRAASHYADDLWHALETNDRVRELATNPLLLTVVAVIFYNNYVLPEDRAALYEECVEVLLRGGRGKADRAAQQRTNYSGRQELSMGLNPKRELLSAVAYAMHKRGEEGIVVSRSELVDLVAEAMARRESPTEALAAAQAFVEELPVHIGLLDEREPDRFRFSHLSFQEFLAARFIAEADRWDELLAHYQESWWREVILLCAGHLSQERCWKFLARLIANKQTALERAMALGLATDALVELERFKGQGPLNKRIAMNALAILDDPSSITPAQARVTAGRVLGLLGDPRAGVCTLPPPMIALPGGSFTIGSTRAEAERAGEAWVQYYQTLGDAERAKRASKWPEDEINTKPVVIRAFELARYQVTNAQYALFIADGGYYADQPWWDDAGRHWLRRDDASTPNLEDYQRRSTKSQPEFWDEQRVGRAHGNYPVVGVSWYEAQAFCRWLTGHLNNDFIYRLPSEAEWEYAARGTTRRSYPWGENTLNNERANYDNPYRGTTAVGSFPQGTTPEGVYDLAGNVWEWTASAYGPYEQGFATIWQPPDEPAEKRFTLRGGGWYGRPLFLRASYRDYFGPGLHDDYVGFRLARHLPESVKD